MTASLQSSTREGEPRRKRRQRLGIATGCRGVALNDWLGTKRVQVDPAIVANLTSFQSLPFGDGLTSSGYGVDSTEHHFTGKERDQESANDYFGARYYTSTWGRFLSPDPGWMAAFDPSNPQSLNLYSYVLNNPLTNTDPTGMYCFYGGPGDTPENDSDSSDYEFGVASASDCGEGGQWIDNSTTVMVTASVADQNSVTVTASSGPEPDTSTSATDAEVLNPTASATSKPGLFTCAAASANKYSIAGGLHAPGVGNNGGAGGFLTGC